MLHKKEVAYWEQLSDVWSLQTSPVCPSSEEIYIYKCLVALHPNPSRVLILGSTPELRNIIGKVTNTISYVVDFSPRMFKVTSEFVQPMSLTKEKWINSNWLEISLKKKSFDLILGDLVLQQVPPKLEEELLTMISSLLNANGVFISRFQFLDSTTQNFTIERIVEKVLISDLSFQEKCTVLRVRIPWLFVDLEKRNFDYKRAEKKLSEFIEEQKIYSNNKIIKHTLHFLRGRINSSRTWTPPSEYKLSQLIKSRFGLAGRYNAPDHVLSKYYPIFALQPISI